MPTRLLPARAGRFALLAAFALIVAVAIFWSRHTSPPAPITTSAPPAPPASPKVPVVEKNEAPAKVIAAADGYIGAAACQRCHAQQHARWLADGHRRGLSEA